MLEHFLLISILKIQIWNTGISFLFDHVVPEWPAGYLRSNHYNTITIIEICLTIELFPTIDVNLLIKYSLGERRARQEGIPGTSELILFMSQKVTISFALAR